MNRRALLTGGLALLAATAAAAPASAAFYWEGLYGGARCGCGTRKKIVKAHRRKKHIKRTKVWNKATAPKDYKGRRRFKSRKDVK